ncbi:hypothetical protein [Chromobacterium haemolyticum]|uniref:Uncharacterized protein n=1 Tax=Chromobacterium haemolyticum TaxID=394935 RepID=A0A1W0CS50_9NEIS|nr:hypothetical protein [Chromobacterium haemolyticum]OQS37615.1 hypothetical protein B0T45_13915 [Chromobacterium haemolyticum]
MDIAKNLKAALSTINGTLAQLKDELAETNAQVRGIESKISELRKMPISLDDWGKYFKAAIEKKAESHLPYVHEELMQSNPHRDHIARNQQPWAHFEENRADQLFNMGLFPEQGSPLSAMCFFFPDMIYERVMARLTERIGTKWGNDDLPLVEERRKLVVEMQQQLDALKEKRAELEAQINDISGALSS